MNRERERERKREEEQEKRNYDMKLYNSVCSICHQPNYEFNITKENYHGICKDDLHIKQLTRTNLELRNTYLRLKLKNLGVVI